MQLVERHLIKKGDPHFAMIDAAAFASKNLYNQANYQIRQAFIHEGKYLPYAEIFHILRKSSSDPLQVGRGVVGAAVLPRRLAV